MRTAADWLKDPQLYTTSAIVLLTDAFGTEFLSWDPLTINMELAGNFGIEPSETLQDMIQAGCALYTTNLFFLSLESFAAMCNALNFGTVTSELFLPPDADDVAWGCTEAKLLLGDGYSEFPYSHNVARFVGAILDDEGIYKAPKILEFAEYPELRKKNAHQSLDGDPIGLKAHDEINAAHKKEIDKILVQKTAALMRQLVELPLKDGSVEFVRNILRKNKLSI